MELGLDGVHKNTLNRQKLFLNPIWAAIRDIPCTAPAFQSLSVVIHESRCRSRFEADYSRKPSVRLQMLPEVGSKITSLIYDRTIASSFFSHLTRGALQDSGIWGLFKDFDNSGFDECLPTVARANTRAGVSCRSAGPRRSVVGSVGMERIRRSR